MSAPRVIIAPAPLKTAFASAAWENTCRDFFAETIARHPVLKKTLMVIDARDDAVYSHLSPEDAAKALEEFDEYVEGKMPRGTMAVHHGGFDYIVINEPGGKKAALSAPLKMNLMAALDHELGHILFHDARDDHGDALFDMVIEECRADAYALIRHYQRCGTDVENLHVTDIFHRVHDLIMNDDRGHFSAFVLEELIKRKDEIDFDKLTPKQTMELAHRFTMHYAPPAPVIRKLHKQYVKVRDVWEKEGEEAAIRTLARITLDPKNTDDFSFRFGKLWLEGYLHDKTRLQSQNTTFAKGELDTIRQKLKEREFKLAQEGILFHVPTRKPTPPAPPKP